MTILRPPAKSILSPALRPTLVPPGGGGGGPAAQGIIHAWELDEVGGTAARVDSLGNSNLVLGGGTIGNWGAGAFANSTDQLFFGSGGWMNMSDITRWPHCVTSGYQGSFAVSFWATVAVINGGGIISNSYDSQNARSWRIKSTGSHYIYAEFSSDGLNYTAAVGQGTANAANRWYLLTWDAATGAITLYRENVVAGTANIGSIFQSPYGVHFGTDPGGQYGTWGSFTMNRLDQTIVIQGIPSSGQRDLIWNGGSGNTAATIISGWDAAA